jgi:hypothetical protein
LRQYFSCTGSASTTFAAGGSLSLRPPWQVVKEQYDVERSHGVTKPELR